LRRIIRPEGEIVARPPGYTLQLPDEVVDAGRFERLCGQARAETDPRAIVAGLTNALGLWRGEAYEEFGELEWARREAVRLDELRANAREELIEARLTLGDHAALVGELEALVAEHPLRERLWQQLVMALYRSGRTADALRRSASFRRLLGDELGLEPSTALRELEARVLADDPTLVAAIPAPQEPARRRPSAATTDLVGRADDVEQLVKRVRDERLVTLTGPGGAGKTRLALRLAAELWDELDGEVFVAELASVRDPASTVAAIATAVDVQQRQHLSVEETLVAYLRGRRALVVLDNCEHLRATVASLVDRLLSWCPDVTILTTSREVLGLPGEQVWRVGSLGLPPEGADRLAVAQAPAVRLFVERAAAARPGFVLDPMNFEDVAEIVRRVDGLPLAIELAAARIRAMSPAALRDRLETGFGLLAGAQTGVAARHRTLQDLVAWSHDLLSAEEQRLFARLCVFAGSFGLDAAEAVCTGKDLSVATVAVLLANLVDKSMVQVVDADIPRYRLLETLREFGRDHLDPDERDAVRADHARWYLELAIRSSHALAGPDEAEAVRALDADFDNLRAAHLWTIEHDDVESGLGLVLGLREYAFRCMHAEITSWADSTMRIPGADTHPRYPVVVGVAAYGRFSRGDLEGAIDLGTQALALAAELGVDGSGLGERALANAWFYRGEAQRACELIDRTIESARGGSPARLAHAYYMRSVAFTSVGDRVLGRQLAEDACEAAELSGSPTAHAQAFYALGLALESTSPAEAAVLLQRAVGLAREAGNRWIEAFALTEVLWLEAREGRPREALCRYDAVVALWYRGGDWANQWLSLRHVFGILVQLQAHLGAATLHGALTAAGAAYALPFEADDAERISALVDDLRRQLGAPAFAAAVRRGAALSDREIIDFVREQIQALAGT
jgi:predicted ATPase